MSHLFTGSGVALVTPFKDGKIDFYSLEKLVEWHIEQGSDAIIACGTTGECATLDHEEHVDVVRCVVKAAKNRIPVLGGSGSNDTAYAIRLSKELEDLGVDGLLLVTPYYNKCSQEGLIIHYNAIADAVNVPSVVYSVASRTGVNITPATVAELAKHPRIVGIKEASGNISQVVEIARIMPDDFAMYSGNDDMIIPLMSVGGHGVITTVGNIAPKDTHDMTMKYLNGDVKGACKMQLDMKPLIDAVFIDVNPIPIKHAVELMGLCSGDLRLPLSPMSEKNLEVLRKEMKAYGLI